MADLARIAVTSEYHFRRLFSAVAGIPLSEYIRRRRLTVAGSVDGRGPVPGATLRSYWIRERQSP